MVMKYIKTESLPRVDDPKLNRALELINEELDKIARVFIDWTVSVSQGIHNDNLPSSPTFVGLTLSGFLNIGSPTAATISSGAITATKSWMKLTGEGDVADILTTINGGSEGDILILKTDNKGYNITVDDAADNIYLDNDCVLAGNYLTLTLIKSGSDWIEIGRGNIT